MGPGTYIYTIGRAEKHSQHCTDRGLFVSFLYWEVFDSTTGPIVCEVCEIGYFPDTMYKEDRDVHHVHDVHALDSRETGRQFSVGGPPLTET